MAEPIRAVWLSAATGAGLLLSGCMMPIDEPAPLPPPVYSKRPADDRGWRAPPPPVWRDAAAPRAGSPSDAFGDYRWIDTAEGLARAIGSAPPDFTFRFDGREAYAWVSNEGEMLIVEPSPLGVIQYFYLPRAAAPYLVRDVYESYAFEGPELVAWYSAEGQLMMDTPSPRSEDRAIALHRRGRAILAASYQRRWDRDVAASYSSQVFLGYGFGAYDSGWAGGWRPHWRDRPEWRERRYDYVRERRRAERLEDERRAREDYARRFDGWRRGGRRGAPPAMMPTPETPVTVPTDSPAEQLRRPRPGRMEGGDAIQPIRIEPRRDRPASPPRTAGPDTAPPPSSAPPVPEPPVSAFEPRPPVERSAPPPVRRPVSPDEGPIRPDFVDYNHGREDMPASAIAAEAERRERAVAVDRARQEEAATAARAREQEARIAARAEARAVAAQQAAEAAAEAAAARPAEVTPRSRITGDADAAHIHPD